MLDDKGRITIPPRIRRALGTEFVTARGTEGSVLVVPLAVWPAIEARLNEELASDDRYLQFAIHNRTSAVLDRQGRLKLPKHLLEWARLESGDAAAIVANGEKFEVWNKRALQDHAKSIVRANGRGRTVS
jgi:MraZ protein